MSELISKEFFRKMGKKGGSVKSARKPRRFSEGGMHGLTGWKGSLAGAAIGWERGGDLGGSDPFRERGKASRAGEAGYLRRWGREQVTAECLHDLLSGPVPGFLLHQCSRGCVRKSGNGGASPQRRKNIKHFGSPAERGESYDGVRAFCILGGEVEAQKDGKKGE